MRLAHGHLARPEHAQPESNGRGPESTLMFVERTPPTKIAGLVAESGVGSCEVTASATHRKSLTKAPCSTTAEGTLMARRLTGRIAVVTGGSTGIGQEIARKLAEEGADVAIADVASAEETKKLVEAEGQRFFGARVDVSSEAQVNQFASDVRSSLGSVDILVNNAAVVRLAEFDDVTLEDWRTTFSVNVDGAFLTAKAFLPDLKESGAGRVINLSSASYWSPPPPFVSYISAKGALNGFTSILATSLAPYSVTANAVAPSLVRTGSAVANTNESFFDMTVQMQNIKRQEMPSDVSGVVAFLASDDANFITGQIIPVDGGISRR
jgi:NAD(P)-dependent dehydrogenase (short-subunit alcohol dehydrogenase family)